MDRGNDKSNWDGQRFEIPSRVGDFKNRYDMPSEVIQDLVQRRPKPFTKYIIDLTTARAATDPFVIANAGRAFQVYFYETGDTNKTDSTTGFAQIRVNQDSLDTEFDGRNSAGFRGDFERLYLSWAAQSGISMVLMVYHFDETPWMHDSNQIQGSVTVSGGTVLITPPTTFTRTVVTLAATTEIALLPVAATRKSGLVYNNTGATLYVGETGVTNAGATMGIPIAAAASLVWNNTAALLGYSVAGGTAIVLSEI